MFDTATAAGTARVSLAACVHRYRWIALAIFWSLALCCAPAQSHAAALDCPELGTMAIPDLFTDLQIKLIGTGNRVDLANEINDAINKLQIAQPNISYAELTNVAIAAYCRVVANTQGLTPSERWTRMRQFDSVLQRQLADNVEPAGTLIIANIPLPPPVYRELQSQAAKVGQNSAQFMAAILSRAAGN